VGPGGVGLSVGGSDDVKLVSTFVAVSALVVVSTFVADVAIAEVCVRLPTALVIADIDEVSVGRKVTLPVKLSGGVNVGKAVGNVPVVGNGKGKPPNISSRGGPEFVSEVEAVVF
jgi:hypothetical protein